MASKINRGFMFYFFLLLGIVLGVVLIGIVIMIFVPTFTPFGLSAFRENISQRVVNMSVYSDKQDTTINETVQFSNYSIENIEINASDCSVKVYKSNSSEGVNYSHFVAIFNVNNFGFTSSEINKSSISINYYADTKTMLIDIQNPEGFVISNSSSIVLQIPPTYSTQDINLEVSSTNAITLGDSLTDSNLTPTTMDLRSVKLKTNNDVLITKYTTIGENLRNNCSIQAGKDVFVNTVIRAEDLTIKAGEAKLKFNEDAAAFDLTGDLSIESNNSFIYFGLFICNNLFLNNSYGKLVFNEDIVANIFIDKESSKCDYDFKNIVGNLTVGSYFDELMVEGGTFNIGDISGNILMATTANINIDRISRLTRIKNASGKMKINSVDGPVDIKTVDGEIILGEIKNDVGVITNGVNERLTIEATGKGKVEAYFNSFDYVEDIASKIITKNGDVKIHLRKNMNRNITATTTSNLTYLGVDIEPKTGTWEIGEVKSLTIDSKANIEIVNK